METPITDYLIEIDRLKKENKKLSEIVHKQYHWESHLSRKIEKLEKENQKLKKELEFYKHKEDLERNTFNVGSYTD